MTPDQLATITIPRSLIPDLMAWTTFAWDLQKHGTRYDPDREAALVFLCGALAVQEGAE